MARKLQRLGLLAIVFIGLATFTGGIVTILNIVLLEDFIELAKNPLQLSTVLRIALAALLGASQAAIMLCTGPTIVGLMVKSWRSDKPLITAFNTLWDWSWSAMG